MNAKQLPTLGDKSFEAIQWAKTSRKKFGNVPDDHFAGAGKVIRREAGQVEQHLTTRAWRQEPAIAAVPPAPTFAEISSLAFNYGEFATIECWAGLHIFGRMQW